MATPGKTLRKVNIMEIAFPAENQWSTACNVRIKSTVLNAKEDTFLPLMEKVASFQSMDVPLPLVLMITINSSGHVQDAMAKDSSFQMERRPETISVLSVKTSFLDADSVRILIPVATAGLLMKMIMS